uniref:Bromo domain-containing protein n=1 Tax=Cyprinus carpio carpio TaxID=630221 RepID=A0A8C1CAN6_CYPCA
MKPHSDSCENAHACDSASHGSPDMNPDLRLTLTSCNGSTDQSGLEDPAARSEHDLAPEIQQAYRIFQSFLSEKHKSVAAPFWRPMGPGDQAEMCFRRMDDKFVNREYESITAFVADFRLMLENCYRCHGVDHWISRQAQKLETILEQKLTLLSRTLREKTTLAVTSRGRFGAEDEKAALGSSSRRRWVPRSITGGGSESVMVQALRLEELQRAKDEKRQREQERKEAEEASVKELEEWESSLLSLAEPCPLWSLWELPAIGHFLCLAQTALHLPEIVFYELERCLLMPRCSVFLAKIMTALLSPPQKRSGVQRRAPMRYRAWESELRRRVQSWYRAVGRAEDAQQAARAERLGLCPQFFWTLGAVSPLEETPFHLLPLQQRVWLLKGLCDHVYETQKEVQDAVLAQPIHECRESILGYDQQDNAYIHFPHFCGADLRIYCQSPCGAVELSLPPIHVQRSLEEPEEAELKDQTYEVKVEEENSSSTEPNTWDVKEDSLSDGEDLDQKCSSGVPSWCREDSLDSVSVRGPSMEDRRLEDEESDCEPCFRVGDSCYKGVSPALNSHRGPRIDANHLSAEERSPCPDCSGASQESPSFWTDPGNTRLRRDESRPTRAQKRKKKKERKFGVKKTSRLSLKKRTARSSLQRAAKTITKKDKRKRHRLGKRFDGKAMLARRPSGSAPPPAQPTFQLVCSSLDDLRVLISKIEDQLDELDGKKRSGRWPHKRAAVKELHITLIRLLNELLPWEPKLVKAFQRNRARLKKECDEFKKHPEYENFIREQMDTEDTVEVACKDGLLSAETTNKLEESEVKMGKTMKEDSETTENVNHESRCLFDRPDVVMHSSESGPFTRGSKRRHTGAISEELSPCKRGKMDPESSLTSDFNVEVASREQATVNPQASVLPDTMSSFHGTCKPIQALLAKSVGNKVTLISHPKAAVMAQALRDHNKTASVTLPPVRLSTTCAATQHSEPVSTETITTSSASESTGQVVYKTAGGVGLLRQGSTSVNFSVQSISDQKSGAKAMQQVVILPSNLLIQSTENKAAQASVSVPKTTTYMSNVSGFTIPENKVPVQPVAPLKDTSTVRTPSAVVTPSLRNLMTVGVPKKTTEPKVALNKSASSGLTKSDAKQELRTVCIRDSQSILVTTRGGNTGVVKVQTSESGTGALPPSPVFNISPQLHAFLVSKSSTSHTQAVSATIAAKSRPGVTPQSTFVAGTVSPLTLNQISNTGTTGKTTIPGKSALLATSKGSDSFLINAKDCAQQNTVSKCGTKPPQKRAPPGSTTPDQSTFQKVFLVTPSPNIPSKVTTTTATCTVPGSRVMFISNSALIIPKETSTSEVNITSTSTPALNVVPNLGTLSCTSGTSIQSIGVPGLTSRILGTNKKPEASMKTTPVIVSRVPATSLTGGLQIGPKSCLVASRSLSGNTESALKVPRTVDGKTLTFSTLGTGHMASSALLSVVKPDVPPSVSALNALHCKPGLSSGSSTSNTSSSYSGSLITKHTTLPINVTANKPVITSLCNSHSLIKTTANTSASAVSSTFALSCSSTLTPPVVMTSGIQPLTSATKNVQEKIVINTTAPLAPGTQLLINNTRFVVPSQGLAPGSHVLLISNSCPGGMQGSSAVGSQRLQVPSPAGPQSFLGSNPVGSQRLQGPSPASPGGLQGSSPVGPQILQGSSPAGSQGLQEPSPASPQSFLGSNPVGSQRLQGSSPAGPRGLQEPSPASPRGLQGPSSAGPQRLQGQSLANPGGLQVPSPASTDSRGPKTSATHTVPSVAQGVRLVTPVRLPLAKVGPSDQLRQQLSTRTPLNVSGPTALSQVAQALRPGVPSDIVRLPIFQTSNHLVTASQGTTRCPKETSLSQGGLLSTTSPMQGRPSQTQVAPVVPPVKAVIPRHSPMVTVPPMSSTISRMQKLPVATVPPIGGANNASLATPISTVPPSMSTVIMTPCPPIRAVQPGTIGKSVILPQPSLGQSTVPVQVPTSAKLLLSPDGAVLNIIQASASSLQVLAKPMAAQVVSSSSSSITVPILNTSDPLRKPDTLGRPNH